MFGRSNAGLLWMAIFLIGSGFAEPVSELLQVILLVLFAAAAYTWWNSKGSGL